MKTNFIQVSVAACLLLQFGLQSCDIDPDETQNSGFSGTIKATVNTGGVDVDEVKVHISPYDLDELSGGQSGGGSSNPAVQFIDGSIDDLHLRSKEDESVKMRAGGVDVDEGLATGTYENGGLTLNFLNPVPDKYLSSLLPEIDAKVTGAFNSGGIKAYKNGVQAGCFLYANVDVNANMNNFTVGDAFAGFVYADRDVTINVSFVSIEAYFVDVYVDENGQPSNNGLHVRKERMQDSPFGSKIFLKKGWNKLYLTVTGAGWEITNKEPSGMKWYFSEGNIAIQGKLRLNPIETATRVEKWDYFAVNGQNGQTSFERGDRIGIYMVDTISNPGFNFVLRGNVPYKKMYGDTFMLATGTDSIRLPTSGRVKFFAYYPWDETTGWPLISWSVADQSDPSKLDLMMASDNAGGKGFGKISIGTSVVRPPDPVRLKFRHMLSKMSIRIVGGEGANIDQNSIAQVTMGTIQGSNPVGGVGGSRLQWGDTVPLVATFHMDHAEGLKANTRPKGYMDTLDSYTKRGVVSFYPATNRSRYTALLIPSNYGGKNLTIKLTEAGKTPEDFMATFPTVGSPTSIVVPDLSAGNQHYIATATLLRGAVRFDSVTISAWDELQGGDLLAQ